MIIHGDSLEELKTLAADSVDAVVTDPPYGLSFMGKKWDYDVPSVELWREVFRVLKPGGHVLSFGGTRTYHRMVCAIEDAGFEIRDQVQWIYGSGFPKSMNVSLAIDKQAGAIGNRGKGFNAAGQGISLNQNKELRSDHPDYVKPSGQTPDAIKWQGFGTALKPAIEPVCLAMKPFTNAQLVVSLAHELCQLKLFANAALKHFSSSPYESIPQSIAQWFAGKSTLTLDVLSEVMDTLHSGSGQCSNLSIELSWLSILAAVLIAESMYTTEMASSLITDLRILKSLLSSSTQESIIPDETGPHGTQLSASLVANLFSAVKIKLDCILTPSAHANVFAGDELSKSPLAASPANEPIVLARKPLSESTVAKNVLKHGTGALNIDGTRIEGVPRTTHAAGNVVTCEAESGHMKGKKPHGPQAPPSGRWPSNVLFDEEAAAMLDEQSGDRGLSKGGSRGGKRNQEFGMAAQDIPLGFGDTGGASRFFYVAKASKRERNAGLEGMPDTLSKSKSTHGNGQGTTRMANASERAVGLTHIELQPTKNNHPTVKPIKLMEYLCTLITPPGGTVLDPFCGSGSTGVAAVRLGFEFVGIEREAEYVKIAEKRIAHASLAEEVKETDEQICMTI